MYLHKNFMQSQHDMSTAVIATRSKLSMQVHVALFGIFCVIFVGCAFSYPDMYTELNLFVLVQVAGMSMISFRLFRLLQSPKNLIVEEEGAFLVYPAKDQEIRLLYSDIERVEGDAEMNKRKPYPFGTLRIKSKAESIELHNVGKLKETIILMREKMDGNRSSCVFSLVEGKNVISL